MYRHGENLMVLLYVQQSNKMSYCAVVVIRSYNMTASSLRAVVVVFIFGSPRVWAEVFT